MPTDAHQSNLNLRYKVAANIAAAQHAAAEKAALDLALSLKQVQVIILPVCFKSPSPRIYPNWNWTLYLQCSWIELESKKKQTFTRLRNGAPPTNIS